MNIAGYHENIKRNIKEWIVAYWWHISVILLVILFFGVWRLARQIVDRPLVAISEQPDMSLGQVMASKTGTKYYFPWCGALGRIKSTNLISFPSIAAALAAGYSPAGNCKGVK